MSGIPSPLNEGVKVEEMNDSDVKIEILPNLEEFSLYWTLDRSSYEQIRETYFEIRSPLFTGGLNSRHSWRMVVSPTYVFESGIEYLGIYLVLETFFEGHRYVTQVFRARFEFSVLDKNGHPMVKSGYMTAIFLPNNGWGISHFLDVVEFKHVLVNNAFQFKCQIIIEGRPTQRIHTGIAARRQFNPEKNLNEALCIANDFAQFYMDLESKDIVLSTSDGIVMAQKHVLMARSPVFNRMFATGMIETSTNLVSIPDFDKETVTGMLQWMSTGKTEFLFPRAPWLLQIAEKYALPGLKLECEQVLVDNLVVANVMRLLLLGHTYNSPYLKNRAVAFLRRNQEEVREMKHFTEMLSSFQRAGLCSELVFGD